MLNQSTNVIDASLIDESQPFKHGILDTLESQSLNPNGMYLLNNPRQNQFNQFKQNIPNFGSLLQPNAGPENGNF